MDTVVDRFRARIAEFQPTERTAAGDLATVQAIIARELHELAAAEGTDSSEIEQLQKELAARQVEHDASAAGLLIERGSGQTLPLPFPGFPAPLPQMAGLKALGQFAKRQGLLRDVLVAPLEKWDEVFLPNGETPVLLAPSGSTSRRRGELRIKSDGGTIWLRSDFLAGKVEDTTAATAYVGIPFRQAGGALTPARASGGQIILDDESEGTLTLKLETPEDSVIACDGLVLIAPWELRIEWSGGAAKAEFSGGSLTIGKKEIKFEPRGQMFLDPERGRFVFAAKPSLKRVNLSGLPHAFVGIDGKPAIGRAGWALPTMTMTPGGGFPALGPIGGWALWLADETDVQIEGIDGPLTFNTPWFEAALDGWRMATSGARSAPAVFPLQIWELDGGRQPFSVSMEHTAHAVIGCDEMQQDYAAFTGNTAPAVSRPVDIAGRTIALPESRVSLRLTEGAAGVRHLGLRRIKSGDGPDARIAIENAILEVRGIGLLTLDGVLMRPTELESGQLSLEMTRVGGLPTLPDPYVVNLESRLFGQRPTKLIADVVWDEDDLEVSLSGVLDVEAAKPRQPVHNPQGTGIDPKKMRRDGQTASGRETRTRKDQIAWRKEQAVAEDFPGVPVTEEGASTFFKLTREFDDARIRMLDVSTRRDQIGVALKVERREQAPRYDVQGLRVLSDLSAIRVFSLPQIQWEPVRTLDRDQDLMTLGYFPTPLASADDGGSTQIDSAAAGRLVPAIPDLTVDGMISAYEDGNPMRMVTTLPFGIKALIRLRPKPAIDRGADRVRRVEPKFETAEPLTGGLQLAVEAGTPTAPPPVPDPGLDGLAYQTANGVDLETGTPQNISVLGSTLGPAGSVEALFNQEFLFSRPKVPVTRLDISGYGGSTFSDWRNPFAAFAEAAKVEFQVMVGRTALEVVKFVSVLYPWGIRVTRSVTIERGSGAGVLRRDSGWQATSSGLLDFQYVPSGGVGAQPSPYEVHPGLIRGAHNVQRIRPGDRGPIELTDGGAVLPMMFDAEIEIGTGASSTRTPFTGVLGYLHLQPVGDPITPGDLSELLDTMGPAGGALDADLLIDASGFQTRVLRAEISNAFDGATPTLVGALRSVPRFGTGGSWSVVAFAGPGDPDAPHESETIDDGMPVIRRGIAGPPKDGRIDVPAPAAEIRFADAEDLFQPTAALRDYAFLQSAPTHSFVYRRPFVKQGSSDIMAGRPSLFADVIARSTGSGHFPPEEMAIVLPSSTVLTVDPAAGVPRLANPVSTPVVRGPVSLSDTVVGGSELDYAGTTLDLDIGADSWSVMLPQVEIQNTILGVDRVTGLRFDLIGGSGMPNRLENMKSLLGGIFSDTLDAIPVLSPVTDVPSIDLGATNAKAKVKMKIVAKLVKKLGDQAKLALTGRFELGGEEVDIPPGSMPTDPDKKKVFARFIGAGAGLELRAEFVLPNGVILVIIVAFDIGFQHNFETEVEGALPVKAKRKEVFNFRAELGAGYGGKAGPFKAAGYVIGIFLYTIQGDAVGFGLGVRWEFSIDAIIAESYGYIEVLGTLLIENSDRFLVGQGELGLNIKVCSFFSIKLAFTVSVKGKIS